MLNATRPAYNMAVQQTNDQELLLNLVRIRYRDTLYFTTVERIAATQEFNQAIGGAAGGTYVKNDIAANGDLAITNSALNSIASGTLSLIPTIALNEKPTVFYAPLEGEKFVRQMMTPMNMDMLILLANSGWSIDRICMIAVQEMNGLKNAVTASGPAPSREPEFREFKEAVRLLRVLQRSHQIAIIKGSNRVEMIFTRNSAASPEAIRFKSLTGLNPERDRFAIMVGSGFPPDNETLLVTTRPLLSALNYLSTGVEVPQRDIEAGKVRQTVQQDGVTPFDWQNMLSDIFRVHSADQPPEVGGTQVYYRNTWFYIDDSDLETKSTFVLLTQLIALHSVPPSASSVSLNIPVR